MPGTPISITVPGGALRGWLHDNPAARALAAQLPLSLDFRDYGGQEILSGGVDSLPLEGMPAGESAPAGTIGWYAPDRVLVLYYRDVGRYPGILRLGEITGDLRLLQGWAGSQAVRLQIVGE